MAEFVNSMSSPDIDPRLLAWLQAASALSPYKVIAYSGYRPGDPRFHGKHQAVDINLVDPATGKTIPNYQNAQSFAAYQQFANLVRNAQMQSHADAADLLRWGGYFSGPKGKYGAMDLMHFDLGGAVGMGGGSWESGLTPAQAALWGLSSGGGVTGTTSSTSPTAAPPSGVRPPPMEPEPSWLSGLKAVGSAGVGKAPGAASPQMIPPDATAAAPVFQPNQIAPNPAELAQPWEKTRALLRQTSPLGELFKVKDVGGAGAMPGRRF